METDKMLIDDAIARLKDMGYLLKVDYSYDAEGNLKSVDIKFVGRSS